MAISTNNVGNILDYVKMRTGTFAERPFNDVDALVLASLTYQRKPDNVITLDEAEQRYGTFGARLRDLLHISSTAGPITIGKARKVSKDKASIRKTNIRKAGIGKAATTSRPSGKNKADTCRADKGKAGNNAPKNTKASSNAASGTPTFRTETGTPISKSSASSTPTAKVSASGIPTGLHTSKASALNTSATTNPSARESVIDKSPGGRAPSTANTAPISIRPTDHSKRGLRTTVRNLLHAPFPETTLADVYNAFDSDDFAHGAGFTGLVDPETTEMLFAYVAANPRFAPIRVGGTEERFSEEDETQFAAETMMLPDGTLVVAFRGTDTSFVGWKEDFTMAFQYPVPAQKSAADYVTRVATLWQGDMILLGHSKGGNLAVYAALNVSDEIRSRIRTIYSLDGPGFPAEVVNSAKYRAIMDRIVKIVPETSIVGMILETPEPCRVVRSTERGMMQHNAFSWQVQGDALVEVPDVSPSSRYFNQSLNEWLAGMSVEQREHAVDALFKVLEASEKKGLIGLKDAGLKSIRAMLGTFAELSDEDRKHLLEATTLLIRASLSIGRPTRTEKNGNTK